MATVRPARVEDAAALAALAERTFRATFTEGNSAANMDAHCALRYGADIQAREIADPRMRTFVGEHAGELVGYAQLAWDEAPECVAAQRPARVQRLYVDAEWHGSGVARDLMSAMLAIAEAGGADAVWLGVWAENRRARAFYGKFGFADVGEHAFRFGDEVQTDLVMVCPVSPRASGPRSR